ncbi:MAG TPA: alpha/beta hydrolase [Niallia sp.]|nr:alpha/beta hydrolase [Niallia sp.]
MLKIIHGRPDTEIANENQQMTLSLSLLDKNPRPFILVFPGGGYQHLADKEGQPVADWLNSIGYHAGVLYYPIGTIDYKQILKELEEVFIQIRQHKDKWAIVEDQIGVIGFSAGGHLAGLAGTKISERANAMLLCYPVVTFQDPYVHLGSRKNFLGEHFSNQLIDEFSIEKLIDEFTPPTFIWHTANDGSVTIQNTLKLTESLSKYNIPFEYHVFPSGRHGLALANDDPYIQRWLDFAKEWLNTVFQ